MTTLVGAPKETSGAENSLEIEELAAFAVEEHSNQNPDLNLKFKKVLKAKKQVVAGTMYHLDIEVDSKHGIQVYNAKVLTKPWEKVKKVEQFQLASGSGTGGSDVVAEAAEHALKGLQQRSNSLIPYELQHVVEAQTEGTNVDLVLKVKRGEKEEQVKAKVNRNDNGEWNLHSVHII